MDVETELDEQSEVQVDDAQQDDALPAADDAESVDQNDGQANPDAAESTAEPEEVVVTIGDEQPNPEEDEHRAPPWVRELRKSNREKDRRIRELEAKVSAVAPAQQAAVVGEEPTLEGCDFDAEKFANDFKAWHARKLEADLQQRKRDELAQQDQKRWTDRIESVKIAAASLKVADHEEAEQVFDDTFSIVQRGIVLGGPDDAKASALLRYALGKNPKKAKELAAIDDPVKFTFALAKLEAQLKVTPRKAAPAPDRPLRSSVAGATAVDSQLARLQAEADKTGDRTKVAAYLAQKNRAKQAA